MVDIAILLDDDLLNSARAGRHNFIGLMKDVLRDAGHDVHFLPEGAATGDLPDHSLVHMSQPVSHHGLTFRRAYHYPFWRIEATERRWAWDVARTPFPEDGGDPEEVRRFQSRWRKRIHGVAAMPPHRAEGHVYVPLQGLLTRHRSFQTMSPIAMIETALRLDPRRRVIATLHPKERYDREDRLALRRLRVEHDRFTVDDRPPAEHLADCAYVVTQNSSVAYEGFLFDRPAILFARIDFHHIALSLDRMSPEDAFSRVAAHRPDFAAYVHWFWQDQSINAGRPEAQDRIAARFRALGWPV